MNRNVERPTSAKLYEICWEFKFGFADLLSYLIEGAGFSKKDLALKLNVHASAISHWLNGSRLPRATTVYSLIRVMALDDQKRGELIAYWHLSLLAEHLKECVDDALENEDEEAAKQVFIDMLQKDWGELYPQTWKDMYISVIQPRATSFMGAVVGRQRVN